MMWMIYRLGVCCYHLGIRVAALFRPKARQWVAGRHNWLAKLHTWRTQPDQQQAPVVWMHCASLGEFEQGRPVLEAIRQAYPHHKLVLTFFSPSGYLQRRHYAGADYVAYLPPDGPRNARRWLKVLQPQLVIFVKYDLWLYHLQAVQRMAIPSILIAAHFRPDQVFFRAYGGIFRKILAGFQQIFTQDDSANQLLPRIGIHHHQVAGDPRIDRVKAIQAGIHHDPLLTAFSQGHSLLVAGSTWPADESWLLPWVNQHLPAQWKLLIAPHEVGEAHVLALTKTLQTSWQRYTQAKPDELASCRVLILDTIGMLATAYRYGRLAYVGGGFGEGIHNTLEPAAYSLPVVFGPRHHKFVEATALLAQGGAFCVQQPADWPGIFARLNNAPAYEAAAHAAGDYIERTSGATARIMDFLHQSGWLDHP